MLNNFVLYPTILCIVLISWVSLTLGPLENVEFCISRPSTQLELLHDSVLPLVGYAFNLFSIFKPFELFLWVHPRLMNLRSEPGTFVRSFTELRDLFL